MAPDTCALRASAGLTRHGDCRHCQRQVDRALDLADLQRLEDTRRVCDFDGYADLDDRPAAA